MGRRGEQGEEAAKSEEGGGEGGEGKEREGVYLKSQSLCSCICVCVVSGGRVYQFFFFSGSFRPSGSTATPLLGHTIGLISFFFFLFR
jgi:hypothetical protein